jgi:hypothetical protein
MNFEKALAAMRKGKKVKRDKWRIFNDKTYGFICFNESEESLISLESIKATDWVVIKEKASERKG